MNEADVRTELATRQRLLVTEAAFLFRRSRRTIYDWVKAGLASERDARGRIWVKRTDVAQWIATHPTRRRSNAYRTT